MTHFPWLTAIVLLPVLLGLIIPWLPLRGNHIVRWYALGVCLVDLVLITYVFRCHYVLSELDVQLREDYSWIGLIDFHWRLGVDGISVALILLTAFVTTLATLSAWPVTRNPRLFYFLMLALYSGELGLFASQDMLLFFLMWELELVPVYLLISMWGGRHRLYAATKFLFYTAGGSIFLLVGALTASLWGTGVPELGFEALSHKTYPLALEVLLYLGFLITYSVKLPALPLHTWLPDTHGEAHYSTCMLLAGILLKMGGYGLIRINIDLLPHAHVVLAPWLATLGACQVTYAALASLGQQNLKRRIAYSSVSHMGFVLLGAGSLSGLGLSGAMLQMISHGLIGAGLFFLAGTSYDRVRTLALHKMGGWGANMPKTFAMFVACSMASLALPGMSGFASELMVFLGMVTSPSYSPAFRAVVTMVEAAGIVLTPIYLLSMVRQMFCGLPVIKEPHTNHEAQGHRNQCTVCPRGIRGSDAGPRELFVFGSLFVPMIGIGLCPELVLPLWSARAQSVASMIQAPQNKAYHRTLYPIGE